MSVLEKLFGILHTNGIYRSLRDFSRNCCGMNTNWASYQRHKNRDLSLQATIACLGTIELQIMLSEKSGIALNSAQIEALCAGRALLTCFLFEKYGLFVMDGRLLDVRRA